MGRVMSTVPAKLKRRVFHFASLLEWPHGVDLREFRIKFGADVGVNPPWRSAALIDENVVRQTVQNEVGNDDRGRRS